MLEWLVRNITYPAHEALRHRPTMSFYREMRRLSQAPAHQVCQLARNRLRELLGFADLNLPYFRALFEQQNLDLRTADPYHVLARLPLLDKAVIRANREQLVYRSPSGGLIPCGSGGTTGDTLHFFIDHARQAQPLACRLFMQGLFDVRPGDRRVHLWGSPIEARGSRAKRLRDRLLNELLLDAFDLGPAAIDDYLARIKAFKPRLIYSYPSAAALLAERAAKIDRPADYAWLKLVVLTGEEITPHHVAQVQQAFGCPVAAEYGNREVGLIAHECPHGNLHIMSPHIHVEILDNDRSVEAGEVGEVVCTTLTTRAQPQIRYRLGDLGRLIDRPCECGLPLPLMQVVGGRTSGFVALPGGKLCYGSVSSAVLRDEPGIVEFRTHQRALDRFEIFLVVDQQFNAGVSERIRQRYRTLFGPCVQVKCRIVDRIPPDPSGKRRHVISDIASDYARFELTNLAEPPAIP